MTRSMCDCAACAVAQDAGYLAAYVLRWTATGRYYTGRHSDAYQSTRQGDALRVTRRHAVEAALRRVRLAPRR